MPIGTRGEVTLLPVRIGWWLSPARFRALWVSLVAFVARNAVVRLGLGRLQR